MPAELAFHPKEHYGLPSSGSYRLLPFRFMRWQTGEILVVSNKFGAENPNPDRDRVVADNVKGVWKEVRGEGRHFYSPIQYHVDTASTVEEIKPNEVGIVKSMTGDQLKAGEFLAEEGQKGIQRRVLTPARRL